jgi:hypothetical protein
MYWRHFPKLLCSHRESTFTLILNHNFLLLLPLALYHNQCRNRDCSHRDLSRSSRDTLHPQKLTVTSLTSGSCLVGIVRSQTQATELLLLHYTTNYTIATKPTHFSRSETRTLSLDKYTHHKMHATNIQSFDNYWHLCLGTGVLV